MRKRREITSLGSLFSYQPLSADSCLSGARNESSLCPTQQNFAHAATNVGLSTLGAGKLILRQIKLRNPTLAVSPT